MGLFCDRKRPRGSYFSRIDFDPVMGAGRAGMLASDFDALEVWNGHGLDSTVTVRVPIARDAFVLVIARADPPLGDPAGSPAKPMPSMAFTSPVYVDADGDGAWRP